MTKEAVNNVLHGTLALTPTCRLLASDSLEKSVVFGDSVAVSMNFATEDQITRAYVKLAAGGSVFHPLADQFWGGKLKLLDV